MNKKHQKIYWISLAVLFIVAVFCFFKNFNLSWVETNINHAKITINFLFPMDQGAFNEHIRLISQREDNRNFSYSLKWLNNQVVEIKLQEENEIKGQKIKLLIHNAPTRLGGLTKSETVTIQFKSTIEILSPKSELLISSTNPFIVQFNTPMNLKQIYKYLQCDAEFYIKPYETVDSNGNKYTDDTKYILIPKNPLENEKSYVLLFKAGMASKSGALLKSNQAIMLQVDKKPTIIKTYPAEGDKWIGLYPRFTLESKEPITRALATINGQTINGILIDNYHAYFLLDDLLKPETAYHIDFQIQVESSEFSETKGVEFSSTTLNQNRFWLDIRCENVQEINCYEGNKLIKTIPYTMKSKDNIPRFGTYYLQGKAEVYENNKQQIGANYWMIINETFGIHGDIRNAYWQRLNHTISAKNIVITDEEAAWLYEKMNDQNMIIIRK